MDQDALNVCLESKRIKIPYKFNFLTSLLYQSSFDEHNDILYDSKYNSERELIDNQVILHMAGQYKPWVYNMWYMSDLFYKYYSMTSYCNRKNIGDTLEYHFNMIQKEYGERLVDTQERIDKIAENLRYICEKKEWPFPFEDIPKGSKIVLYGAGDIGKDYYKLLEKTNYASIVIWVDIDTKKQTSIIRNPQEITDTRYDYILVAVKSSDDIKDIISCLMVPKQKIVTVTKMLS